MSKNRLRKRTTQSINPLENFSDEDVLNYIFDTKRLTTPFTIDTNVSKFCKQISLNEKPIFLDVTPQPWSRLDYCNKNVERMIELNKGKMVLGYKIWYTKSLYIEAERHAIWKDTENNLIDITFNKSGEKRILFLPAFNLRTVVANSFTKPRMSFHPAVEKAIKIQLLIEKNKLEVFTESWESWEKAISFEKWKEQ